MNDVIVLFDGYSNDLGDGKMEANCTCTLIKGRKNIIVDTMTAWDKQRIIDVLIRQHGIDLHFPPPYFPLDKKHYFCSSALAATNILPDDIHYVVCTHSHSDHIGNNNLFTNAEHIVGSCVQNRTIFRELEPNSRYTICEGVNIILTPGHTYDDITVIVDSMFDGKRACIAITGDLFEKELDIYDPTIWKQLGKAALEKVQAKHRLDVIITADFIVPGHGRMFEVTDHMRELLLSQYNSYP